MILGIFRSNQVAAIGAIAAVLGRVVSVGSNVSTLQETMAAINAAEALRYDRHDRSSSSWWLSILTAPQFDEHERYEHGRSAGEQPEGDGTCPAERRSLDDREGEQGIALANIFL